MAVNVRGLWMAARYAVPVMKKQKSGYIINVSSGSGLHGAGGNSTYCASKFAVMGINESLLKELRDDEIRVTAVCPGQVDTAIFDLPPGHPQRKKMLRPEDIAELVHYLVSTPTRVQIPQLYIGPVSL